MFLLRGQIFSPFSCSTQAHTCMLSFKLLELQTKDAFSLSIQIASQRPRAELMQICSAWGIGNSISFEVRQSWAKCQI